MRCAHRGGRCRLGALEIITNQLQSAFPVHRETGAVFDCGLSDDTCRDEIEMIPYADELNIAVEEPINIGVSSPQIGDYLVDLVYCHVRSLTLTKIIYFGLRLPRPLSRAAKRVGRPQRV
jgi:hypothetical protein